ncbi:MAG: hypothetical protein WD669_13230 [Pirellulales bacterium]
MNERHDLEFGPLVKPAATSRRRYEWWIVAGVLIALVAALATIGREMLRDDAAAPPVTKPEDIVPPPDDAAVKSDAAPVSAETSNLIEDDGHSMWASPTSGKPLRWEGLPPGVQIVLALRPSALAANPEGEKVLAALGPLGGESVRSIEQITGIAFREIERLLVGWRLIGDQGTLAATIVVYAGEEGSRKAKDAELSSAAQKEHAGQKYWQLADRAYYRPERANGPSLIVAPADAIEEIIDLGGEPPPLRRDVERLLAKTDADRHATLIVAPGALFGESRDVFAGELPRLRGPLFWFLGDDLSAAALSLHWDDNFYLEAVATPTLDVPVGRAVQQLADRVSQLPDLVESYVVALDASPHSRRVVARLPAMCRKLATYTRSGFDRDLVVLRCYLPAIAGHNLLMAAELALAEPPPDAVVTAPRPVAEATSPVTNVSVDELLKRPLSLRVPRDTLEAILGQLARDIGVEIVIRGPDLQLDGITKNQSLAIDLENQPAESILVEILRRANPDKSAAGPDDPRQKLVYVIGPKSPGGPEVIFVTTRARAAERGEPLPAVFVDGK